ncbi:MAG TPA: hypothetical protein VJB90_05885 [Candidatus Nanoarchaeia archaeon]|nr:hypothetical protein [Candidatus Nanoarchaeia archaeon]
MAKHVITETRGEYDKRKGEEIVFVFKWLLPIIITIVGIFTVVAGMPDSHYYLIGGIIWLGLSSGIIFKIVNRNK